MTDLHIVAKNTEEDLERVKLDAEPVKLICPHCDHGFRVKLGDFCKGVLCTKCGEPVT